MLKLHFCSGCSHPQSRITNVFTVSCLKYNRLVAQRLDPLWESLFAIGNYLINQWGVICWWWPLTYGWVYITTSDASILKPSMIIPVFGCSAQIALNVRISRCPFKKSSLYFFQLILKCFTVSTFVLLNFLHHRIGLCRTMLGNTLLWGVLLSLQRQKPERLG